jgi:arylsulfatase A-like enzyme
MVVRIGVVFLVAWFALVSPARAERPNFILAMADDQGWGDMAYQGDPALQTPTFDEMARNGLRWDRFHAAAPVCSPTRGSVLTGRHPNRFGCFQWGYTLRPEEITLAEVLRREGYRTGHFGKWHLGSLRPDSPVNPGQSGFDTWFSSPNFFDLDPWMCRNGQAIQMRGEGSEITVNAALDFIRDASARHEPFLAVIWFGSPHAPHQGTPADQARYADEPSSRRAFLAEVTAMDRAMGTLRRALRELGLADNTVLWYTSDNGAIPQGSTGGLRGRKGTVWEGGLRVPGLMEWPARIRQPRRITEPCGTVDIFPTLLDLAGVKVPPQRPLDGVSLAPLLAGEPWRRSRPLGFWDKPSAGKPIRSSELLEELAREQAAGAMRPNGQAGQPRTGLLDTTYPEDRFPGHAAWIDGPWKLHRIENPAGRVQWLLYNLDEDENETKDIAASHAERVAAMSRDLETWLKSVVRSLNGNDYVAEASRNPSN